MEPIHLPYSLKNIPIPSRFNYQKQLVSKVEHFTRRLRIKMHFILNPPTSQERKETFGFKSNFNPPQMKELKAFEDDLFNIINNIRYKPINNSFQRTLKEDRERILNTEEVIVSADKTANLYKMKPQEYRRKMHETITKEYRKCETLQVNRVIKDAAQIARNHDLDDRVDAPTQAEAFITVKDHKPGFPGRVECRLINPAKNSIGTISKSFLDRINRYLRVATRSNQWQNTATVLRWFNSITHKAQMSFFKFDIVSFYPSISEKLLRESLAWAGTLIEIPIEQINTILHCRRSFLFFNQEPWVKKEDPEFDCGMGSLDSAEVCELIGLFILSKLELIIPREHIGLYRDDGLAVVNLPGPQLDRLRKEVINIFSSHGLSITVEAGIKITDFLDVSLNLENGEYRPYRKDAKPPVYIQKASNHPPNITKQLPDMIGKRISSISYSKEVFDSEAAVYNTALKNSGYLESIRYSSPTAASSRKSRKRRREVLWFNPPWNSAVATNVAAKFLRLVDKHFNKESPLHRYFNRHTIKVSYSCMPNMASIISGHNRKVSGLVEKPVEMGCNCRGGKEICMLQGSCQTSNLIYKCVVSSTHDSKEYIGLTSNTFKQRYSSHKASFTHRKLSSSTALSTYIWDLKDREIPHTSTWSILKRAPPYSRETKMCQLCLTEKTLICLADHHSSLNKRNEIMSKCRHRAKHLLKNW